MSAFFDEHDGLEWCFVCYEACDRFIRMPGGPLGYFCHEGECQAVARLDQQKAVERWGCHWEAVRIQEGVPRP